MLLAFLFRKELISQTAFTSDSETVLRDGPDATGVFSRYLGQLVNVHCFLLIVT